MFPTAICQALEPVSIIGRLARAMVVWPREAAYGIVTCEKKVIVHKTEIRSSSFEIPTKVWKRLRLTAGDVLHVVIKEDKEFGTIMYNELAEIWQRRIGSRTAASQTHLLIHIHSRACIYMFSFLCIRSRLKRPGANWNAVVNNEM